MNESAGYRGGSPVLWGRHVRKTGYAPSGRYRNSAMIVCSLAFLFQSPFAHGQGGDPLRGEKLINALGCMECHTLHGVGGGEVKAPEWANIFGTTEELEGGGTVVVDEAYIRESIQNPDIKVVKGYPAGKMPAKFKFLPEADLAGMVAYIKSQTAAEPSGEELAGEAASPEEASQTVVADSQQAALEVVDTSDSRNIVMGLFVAVAVCAFALGACPPSPRLGTTLSVSRKPWHFPWSN